MVILNEKEAKAVLKSIKKSLLKQVALSAKYGFDVKKHWEDMQESLNTSTGSVQASEGK